MKTLIFNGSPREDGCTAYLTNLLEEKLKGDVRVVRAHTVSIGPCKDCRHCWENFGCLMGDDMQEVYDYIKESDNIVIASPLQFSELAGALLSVLSRLQVFYAARKHLHLTPIPKEKKGAVILCGGGSGGADKAEDTAKTLLREMNAAHIATVSSLKTDTIPAREDKDAVEKIADLARVLNGV
jgi:multimeric flavodoxin WrbA